MNEDTLALPKEKIISVLTECFGGIDKMEIDQSEFQTTDLFFTFSRNGKEEYELTLKDTAYEDDYDDDEKITPIRIKLNDVESCTSGINFVGIVVGVIVFVVLICIFIIMLYIKRKKTIGLSQREAVDPNPNYGDGEYAGEANELTDNNEYYDSSKGEAVVTDNNTYYGV